ncbi:hypothetical protein LT330_005120 [Penicillium expansum]|uniref:Uncharacterized protein n=1 Tax=Penicillium expansum TaxID=27334 RepID=A0A0A2K7Y9_PENEN|nr:hypothetical protein PEX2_045210 [Penicillium expansum]KAJ5518800.1 hypothetical protein N7453_001222 [Penicillium expansum]KAK4870066.1 hypothetical protein LT330_005120 [Penicillium expansum]KGO47395.1 hypothetical protein PEXP_081940 [Penicillium expansum]KGO62998.1 hypothetical protein PEX2_045210 [Penicillium expansum]KGO70422.1 hypothetical protein PEX1_059300 [Penicillium expansum]
MKSPVYVLAVLLPLLTQIATANPVAEPEFDDLEERGRGNDKDNNHHGWDDKNVCEVKRTYPYYKYPCSSSPKIGTSIQGAIFTPSCRYQNGDSGVWYLAPKGWVKDQDKPRRCPGTTKACT